MITKIVEVVNGLNWGKFMVARFDHAEWSVRSSIDDPIAQAVPLLSIIGQDPRHVWVFDLQTCEGACFRPGGAAEYDLNKHRIWVCPMFEPFLVWLYQQNLDDLSKLPALVHFNQEQAPAALFGYRRDGSETG